MKKLIGALAIAAFLIAGGSALAQTASPSASPSPTVPGGAPSTGMAK